MGLFELPEIKAPEIKAPKIKKVKLSNNNGIPSNKRGMKRLFSNKRIREPIPANIKKKVKLRAKDMCEVSGCKINKYLELHHKNMKNDDNNVANIILLCPFHHREIHANFKKIVKKDFLGNEISSKIISKKSMGKSNSFRKKKKTIFNF